MIPIPSTDGVKDPAVRRVLDAICQQVRVWQGAAGKENERIPSLGELKTLGIIGEDARGTAYRRIPDQPATLTDHEHES